jgi:hypothetical protein
MPSDFHEDIEKLERVLRRLPRIWDAKSCILELKNADYNWRQMEWVGFYFEYKTKTILDRYFAVPGDKYGNVSFDLKGAINWDLKASAIKTDSNDVILNDKEAMDLSVAKDGYHGEIIALCDVEYNDESRSFQRWHTELKGGMSKYELDRIARNARSRYRKTRAELVEVLLIVFAPDDLNGLKIMQQGRNSDGSPRRVKYMLDLEDVKANCMHRIKI